jgi:DNA-binding response OmpR family regulator
MALRIIIADDDRDTVLSLATILLQEGHEVREVYRGDAVLDQVRAYKPDVVLLDIGMPGLTGFEIARHVRQELGRARPPLLIAVTAWTQSSAKVLGKLVGFDHYLTKPYATDELLGLIAPLRRTA